MSNESIVSVMPSLRSLDAAAEHNWTAGAESIEVREVTDLKSLESFAVEWNALLPRTPGASYFHSFNWFATYWKHCARAQRMRVLLVFDRRKLAGVVPLIV